jgi:hypothetical protein
MTVEAWSVTPEYTVAGIGPYAITHPYAQDAIRAFVVISGVRTALTVADFTVTPIESDTTGNLFLTATAAATHAGRKLIIDRITPDEQGWLGVQGEREAGLEVQLDRIVQAVQELRSGVAGALRVRGMLDAFDWTDGTVPVRDGARVISGPTTAEIANAQAYAVQAAASAAAALAKENSMLRARGAWANGVFYSPSDQFTFGGEVYLTLTPHFATTVAADLAAGRILLWVAKGASGGGSGDMLKSENLAGLTNVPLARANLALGALATKALAAFADLDPSAIITALETLAANKIDNAIPTARAVTDYVDGLQWKWLTPQNTTSGSVFDFTGISAGATEVELLLSQVRHSGTIGVQLRTAGAPVTSGYLGITSTIDNTAAAAKGGGTDFPIFETNSNFGIIAAMLFTKWPTTNEWIARHTGGRFGTFNATVHGGGNVTLPGALDGVRLLVTGGAANQGKAAVRYR